MYLSFFQSSNGFIAIKAAAPVISSATYMEKGWEQVVAVLGILASGAAYVQIDRGLPRERRFLLTQQCDIGIALTTTSCDKNVEWPEDIKRISIDALRVSWQDAAPMRSRKRSVISTFVLFLDAFGPLLKV